MLNSLEQSIPTKKYHLPKDAPAKYLQQSWGVHSRKAQAWILQSQAWAPGMLCLLSPEGDSHCDY